MIDSERRNHGRQIWILHCRRPYVQWTEFRTTRSRSATLCAFDSLSVSVAGVERGAIANSYTLPVSPNCSPQVQPVARVHVQALKVAQIFLRVFSFARASQLLGYAQFFTDDASVFGFDENFTVGQCCRSLVRVSADEHCNFSQLMVATCDLYRIPTVRRVRSVRVRMR